MPTYQLGSHGAEVRQIQQQLQAQGLYLGPLDGVFGGGTQSAVKAFQGKSGLEVDGVVGPYTWKALFKNDIPAPSISNQSLDYRCLALTGAFETSLPAPECYAGLSGDFDGQGLSFGALQWNLGQDSLQPLLEEMAASSPDVMRTVFQDNYEVLMAALKGSKQELMQFARSIQHPVTHAIYEPWRGMFKALGRTEAFQAIELWHIQDTYRRAKDLAGKFGLWSQRGTALMFDIVTQNGGISDSVAAIIRADFQAVPSGLGREETEVARLRVIANRRAEAAKAAWVEDVRTRKLCIANGEGIVHGTNYSLAEQFGIGLIP